MGRRWSALLLVGVGVLVTGFLVHDTVLRVTAGLAAQSPGAGPGLQRASTPLPASPELLALGEHVYARQCAACHGTDGRGQGAAAYLLYPRPRDFVTARYRLVSTWESAPTDEDLFQTISRGMPGSVMPSWGHLPEPERWGLVHYIKAFAETPLAVAPTTDATDGNPGTGVIRVPPEPPFTPEARARAQELYGQACASCHGLTGKGDGVEKQLDDRGYPSRPRDLTVGVFKGSPEPAALYRRIVAGMPGSPMPMNDWAYGEDAWHLVHLVRSWSSDEQRSRAEMQQFTLVSRRVPRVPEHPDDGAWRSQCICT